MRNRKGSEAFANPAPTAVWLIQIVSELCLSCAHFPALLPDAEKLFSHANDIYAA